MIKKLLLISVIFLVSCSERAKNNPFDPTGDININLQALAFDRRVELYWQKPNVDGYTGFNVYRKIFGLDNSFKRLASELPASQTYYQDRDLTYGYSYAYYLTITGIDVESKPSNQETIYPGPGLNWIVDRWGYQVVKTTYDLAHPIFYYNTNWPPSNLAVVADLNESLILYLDAGRIEKLRIDGEYIQAYTDIRYPYDIAYDPQGQLFWIIDSSGALYTLDTQTDRINTVSTSFSHPVSISIAPDNDLISIADPQLRSVVQYRRDGSWYKSITNANGKLLTAPVRYEIDETYQREWLVDRDQEVDYIYTRSLGSENFNLVDSTYFVRDLAADPFDGTCWYLSYNIGNSSSVQLSPDGTRQSEIDGFNNPLDIQINPYDGTLLMVESSNYRALHFDHSLSLLGELNIFNFPVKIRIE